MSALPPQASDADAATEVRARVRERLRTSLRRHGASPDLDDPAVLDAVEALLRRAADQDHPAALLLPEVLGDPPRWRLETALTVQSHRPGLPGALLVFVKTRLLLPCVRWLFEYGRDNFERQQRVNLAVFACLQELAIENARLRREIERLPGR